MNLFDISKQKNELKKLEEETLKEEFWKNENSTKVLGKIKSIKKICNTVKKLEDETQNLIELTQLMKEDFDGEIKTEILKNTKNLEKEVEIEDSQSEKIIRRANSNSKIKKQNIACYEELPCIESSNEVKIKSLDEICKRALASFLVIQLACDINNGQYDESVKIISKLLEKFNVSDCLNKKEKKLIDGTYEMQDAIDIDWEYETYWSLVWALGLVEDISDASNICDCNYAIKLFNESNSYEDFKSKCKLREVNEILDMLDLYYRYHWACVEKRIKPETSIGNLNSSVVIERRRGLEWIIREIQDWYDISLDT